MIQEISINPIYPYFVQITSLENVAYQFEFVWNDREERWRMSILDMQDKYLLINIKIMPMIPLVKRYKIKGLFSGELVGFNIKNENEIPTRENLGKDFKLIYVPLEDIIAIKKEREHATIS